MNDNAQLRARERRSQIRAALNDTYDGLDEAWRALGRDSSLSNENKKQQRKIIEDQMADLDLQEGRLNEEALRARDQDAELDGLVKQLEGTVADIQDEVDRMRRAERTARNVAKIAGLATKALGFLAKIIV